jgi:hypothetical protein
MAAVMLLRDPDCAGPRIISGAHAAPKPFPGSSGSAAAAWMAREAQLMLLDTRQPGRRLHLRSNSLLL